MHHTIRRAVRLRREIDRFRAETPELTAPQRATPAFTWEQVERQVIDLAGPPSRRTLAADLVSALRKQAWCKPPEMVLREILLLATTLSDESFRPGPKEEPR